MVRPQECSVQEAESLLTSDTPPRLIDVREQVEYDIVHLEGGQLLTRELIAEMVDLWPPDTPIICYCHHGVRSQQVAMYLAQQGFGNVLSMRGGIDAWAREIDPSLPLY